MTRTEGHPSAYILAELAEGALPDAQQTDIRAHVGTCDSCTTTLAQLTDVTSLLRSAPAEIPTPPDVSIRIEAALAREVADVQAEAEQARDRRSTAGDGQPVAWFRRRLPQALAAAATAAVVGLVGYGALVGGGDSPVDVASGDQEESAAQRDTMTQAEPELERPGVDAQDDTLLDDPAEQEEGDATTDDLVSQTMISIWEQRTEVEPGCGQALADDLQLELAGSAFLDDQVVVVLSADDELFGWVLPSCAEPEAAIGPVTEPVPAD